MLNRELQESMNLPPFINTAGGLGEPPSLADEGKKRRNGGGGGKWKEEGKEREGEEEKEVMCRRQQQQRHGGREWWRCGPGGGSTRPLSGSMGGPRFPRLCLTVT